MTARRSNHEQLAFALHDEVSSPRPVLSEEPDGGVALQTAAPPRLARLGKAAVEYISSKSLLTPSTGFIHAYKFTLNPYSGCGFGCEYCYARFFAPTLEEQETWGEWVKVKQNAVELLRRARWARSRDRRLEPGDTIYMSTVTDPYQPIEHKLQLTRSILEVLVEIQPRLTIQTRSPLVKRDIDLLKQLRSVRVNLTVTTDSEHVRLRYEPHCPAVAVRLEAAQALKQAGIPIGISISPMLPVEDAPAFARRLAALEADEYVTQFLKPARSRFSAGTAPQAIARMREDRWTRERYEQVRAAIQHELGSRRLLEGNEGYAPPP